MPRTTRSLLVHDVLANMLNLKLIREWRPGEYLITAKGKKLRTATLTALKWGLFQ